MSTEIGIESVKDVVVTTLQIEDRADSLGPETPLFGSLPELDSMAVLELIHAFEERFGITVDGEDLTADAFDTLSTLTGWIEQQH